jgi:hypothetical protein
METPDWLEQILYGDTRLAGTDIVWRYQTGWKRYCMETPDWLEQILYGDTRRYIVVAKSIILYDKLS